MVGPQLKINKATFKNSPQPNKILEMRQRASDFCHQDNSLKNKQNCTKTGVCMVLFVDGKSQQKKVQM